MPLEEQLSQDQAALEAEKQALLSTLGPAASAPGEAAPAPEEAAAAAGSLEEQLTADQEALEVRFPKNSLRIPPIGHPTSTAMRVPTTPRRVECNQVRSAT